MSEAKPLAKWLERVIDESKLYDRSKWASLLGVSRQAISQWINGRDLPGADKLDLLLTIIREHYATQLYELLQVWAEMSVRPMSEVWSGARTTASTLSHYLSQYALSELQEALSFLAPQEQSEVCFNAIYDCNERRLRDQREEPQMPHTLLDSESVGRQIQRAAPESVARYGLEALVNKSSNAAREPTTWGVFAIKDKAA